MSKPELTRYKERMDKAITALKEEFAGLRTGRANAGLIENVMVDAYGSTSPITSVAAISVPEPITAAAAHARGSSAARCSSRKHVPV